MAARLQDLPTDLVHIILEAYVRKADAKVVLGRGPWVSRLLLGPSAVAPDGVGYKLICERLKLVRTSDAPTWSDVVRAMRSEPVKFPFVAMYLCRVLDDATDPYWTTHNLCELFQGLCLCKSAHPFRAALACDNLPARGIAAALAAAVLFCRVDLARLALDHGAPVDGADGDGAPLQRAVANGDVEIARLLMERGADWTQRRVRSAVWNLARKLPDDQSSQAILQLLRGEH